MLPSANDNRTSASLPAMLAEARRLARSRGVVCASYRIVPSFHSQLHASAILYHFGFPPEWVGLYDDDSDFRQDDPIADYVIREGRTMSWKQAIAEQDLTPSQRRFVAAMEDHDLTDGWAMPCYGPGGREAYVSYSLGRPVTSKDRPLQQFISQYVTDFHHRVCQLLDRGTGTAPSFSKRETEVLQWIGRGKSNSDIATILGISQATVDTFVKRIFRKLEVHDRMTATLRGLQHGKIRL